MKTTLIAIETTRFSEFLKKLFQEYEKNAVARIDGKEYQSNDFPELIKNWVSNRNIIGTKNFTLSQEGMELFGFHDHPKELWAACSELPFIESLVANKMIKARMGTLQL